MGPNVKRLICHKASLIMIPPGGGIVAGVSAIVGGKLPVAMKQAAEWVAEAIKVVRTAPDADPNWTDEDIAGKILAGVDERRAARLR